MVKREVLRGATVAVAAAIMTTSMSLANPMVVEAKVKPVNMRVSASTVVDRRTGLPIENYAEPNDTDDIDITVQGGDGEASAADFNLSGIWTYLENSANNPVPVMVEQSANVWVVAMYQGTSAVFGVNQNYGAGMVPTVAATSTGCVATAGNEAGIIVNANTVGTDVITYHLVNPQAGAPVTATAITIAVNVVPAAPGTGNGIITNSNITPAQPATTTQTSTAKTDREKEDEFIRLLNAERAKLGLIPLRRDSDFDAVAQNVMPQIKKKFAHTASVHFLENGFCNEELHRGSYGAEGALRNFKASEGHWIDMIDEYADSIGIAYSQGYWVVLPGVKNGERYDAMTEAAHKEEFGEDTLEDFWADFE